jgi:hypothetical protein
MVKRIAAIGVVTFVSLAVCAVGQNADQSRADALPDAPSVRAAAAPVPEFKVFAGQVRSPFRFDGARLDGARLDGARLPDAMRPDAFADPDKKASAQKRPDAFLVKYLDPGSAKQKPSDHLSGGDSFMGRATHAAAGIFFTRDESGKGRLNTSYFLRAVTLAAADTASRPYWRRSAGEPFSAFGSTVGNDAGMNLLHEFGPGIQHAVKNHGPKFVARIIGDRLTHH